MTVKYNDYGSTEKITANKYTLNYISILAMEAADKYDAEGADALAKQAREFSEEIYNQLFRAGLYK